MTKDDIQKLILESNVLITTETNGYQVWMPKNLEKFAELVAAVEREACAKVAENGRFLHDDSPEARFGKSCAAAIRARGQ